MYNNYTPLQQRQLALQEYSNTQSTYLLVCASARSTALKATLTDQLHRKFRLVDRLDGELTASVDGVLLAAEDVELMSTALMYFAKALQDGADYAVCNAVFGFGGATALYQSQPLQAQNRCAVVSRTLLEHCRAAAHDLCRWRALYTRDGNTPRFEQGGKRLELFIGKGGDGSGERADVCRFGNRHSDALV